MLDQELQFHICCGCPVTENMEEGDEDVIVFDAVSAAADFL